MAKNPPPNTEDTGDVSLTPGLGRCSGGGNAIYSSILAWRIPWTEEPGWLQFMGSQIVGTTEHTHTHLLFMFRITKFTFVTGTVIFEHIIFKLSLLFS